MPLLLLLLAMLGMLVMLLLLLLLLMLLLLVLLMPPSGNCCPATNPKSTKNLFTLKPVSVQKAHFP
jgi:hypothetical protein